MSVFEREYARLNEAQRQAVDQTEGPLLVLAGPGTGKTQLLSARVAHILQQTDTMPQGILCLTFTENGAENMRERLTRFIGQAAYDVTISTYHAFGGDLIRRYPEYFIETRLQNPVDELGRHQILSSLVERLSYDNPLKQTRHHIGDLISTISEVKRALLTGDDLRSIATQNALFISEASHAMHTILGNTERLPASFSKAEPLFQSVLDALVHIKSGSGHKHFQGLRQLAVEELQLALADAAASNKSTPLTAWKNRWLKKDDENRFIFAGELENRRISALANILEGYQQALEQRGLYDFDDMIIRAIQALENNLDLKYSLQEQYLYLLLDEFQDTNAAQLRLVELLTDNPVNERRPNVMAVGDDDQAIYAFQGAKYSNMLDFYHLYDGVKVVNLTENYRSHTYILETAQNIATQIGSRLDGEFEGITKNLVAATPAKTEAAHVTRTEFESDIAQYDWIAAQIQHLIKTGVEPKEIAVLAPKHKQLEPLVGYLNARKIAVRYEKRENILEAPIIKQLLSMTRLVLALSNHDETTANALWPEVLSYDFWELPVSSIWELSWQMSDNRTENPTWSRILLEHPPTRAAALLFLTLAHKATSEGCETMIDYLIGNETVSTHESDMPFVTSPLRHYFSNQTEREQRPQVFYETLSHLKVLRSKLRDFQLQSETALTLQDLVSFVNMYEVAEERMMNTSPYNQQSNAVQLMTVFKAKGLEFEHVFLPCCHDDVWGSSSRGNSNKLTLPANLTPIRHAGATDDERLRILYVALTRAKKGLHLTSYRREYSGKNSKHLKYLNEQEQSDGSYACLVLPPVLQAVRTDDHNAPLLQQLEVDWRARHVEAISNTELKSLLDNRLKNYRLSPTHVNNFLDTIYGGPETFFFNTLLRFPQAPTVNGQFGNAIHETLEWLQQQCNAQEPFPQLEQIENYFAAQVKRKKLIKIEEDLQIERGQKALRLYVQQRRTMFKAGNKVEHNFAHENVQLGDVRMSGKIDLMEINKTDKTIVVVDYKTGKSFSKWSSDAKLHKYKQQLYCYKLLIENSRSFKDYDVIAGRLEFVEPDSDGHVNNLTLTFDPKEVDRTKRLLTVLWKKVMTLDFPDISDYEKSLAGIKAFEADLLA